NPAPASADRCALLRAPRDLHGLPRRARADAAWPRSAHGLLSAGSGWWSRRRRVRRRGCAGPLQGLLGVPRRARGVGLARLRPVDPGQALLAPRGEPLDARAPHAGCRALPRARRGRRGQGNVRRALAVSPAGRPRVGAARAEPFASERLWVGSLAPGLLRWDTGAAGRSSRGECLCPAPQRGCALAQLLRCPRRGPLRLRGPGVARVRAPSRSEEHTSELQSRGHLVCRLLLEKKKNNI